MSSPQVVTQTALSLPPFIKGKVRDTYYLGEYLLIVATDRISAFDVILNEGVPFKGLVLNQISAFWFKKTENIIQNHVVEVLLSENQLDKFFSATEKAVYAKSLLGRSMVVKSAKRLPLECVVRGYITGSAMAEYQKTGTVCGISLPAGLRESERLSEPIFTPTTKAENGHDLPLTMDDVEKLVGKGLAREIKTDSIKLYNFGAKHALEKGIIIADTKVEYGVDGNGRLMLIDELLTPDSSRFWDAGLYQVGRSQPSYDKQPVRDWLTETGWNKEPPPPHLSKEVIKSTSKRYVAAFEKLTEAKLSL